MKRYIWYFLSAALVCCAVLLMLVSPDGLSIGITCAMAIVLILSIWFGILPIIRYALAFDTAMDNIHRAMELKPDTPWVAVQDVTKFFGKADLDEIFDDYKSKVQQQRRSGMVINDIDEFINEDVLSLRSWQGVIHQIPGTLTGLGILGTFIGLIVGIRDLQFDTMQNAIFSIQNLLGGINVAFYTSIAGVIMSILFNILNKVTWGIMVRELGLFTLEFKRCVIPPEEEQSRFRQKQELQEILTRLDRLPKNGAFSLANSGKSSGSSANESILLPQIISGLKNDEFTFFLQPRYDLNTRKIIGAEALVRWKHPKLGLVMPSVFMQTIENNGYITKLDHYIWEQVCCTIRRWIDSGMPVVPINVNISKTDILAMDVAAFFKDTVQKYRIPPRYLEMDISENAYLQTQSTAVEAENALRQSGFRVALDGFNGDFMALNTIENFHADMLKLDLRFLKDVTPESLTATLNQAGKMNMSVAAEGIENMEQMSALRKSGCVEGQGYYLSKPMSIEDFETELNKR